MSSPGAPSDEEPGLPSLKIVAVLFAVLLVVVIATVVVLGARSGDRTTTGTSVTLPTPTTYTGPAAPERR